MSKSIEPRARARQADAPIAIIDIGSNSVRLVVYEAITRAPTPIFNEKAFCGLGKNVATTGELSKDAMDRALAALKRFRILCDIMEIEKPQVVATAAARDARNGPQFLQTAEKILGAPVALLAGRREAEFSALGVISSIYQPDGVVGDLGGGSLELIDIKRGDYGKGQTMPLGALALMDISERSPKQAVKIARAAIAKADALKKLPGRSFYAVGGTWRALARLHMRLRDYPLNIMHNYTIPAADAADFTALVERVNTDALGAIESISAQRRPLLTYGAIVLEEIIRAAAPRDIVVSVAGVREGMLYDQLAPSVKEEDPLIAAAAEFNETRARDPRHGWELAQWCEAFFKSTGLADSVYEARLRLAASLLADISWRANPDYRGEQAFDMVANSALVGIDHAGRSFIALTLAVRHCGLNEDISPRIRALVSLSMQDHARILGAAMRIAFVVSAGISGVLPRAPLLMRKKELVIALPPELENLAGERLMSRLKQLAKLIGREPMISRET